MGIASLLGKGVNSRVKILLDREISVVGTPIDFITGAGDTSAKKYVTIPYATIGFIPRFILLWSGYEKVITVCLIYADDMPYSYSGGITANNGAIFTNSNVGVNATYQLTGNAYVNATGVQLPIGEASLYGINMIAVK